MGLGDTRQTYRAASSESESAGAENDRNAVPGRYHTSDLALITAAISRRSGAIHGFGTSRLTI